MSALFYGNVRVPVTASWSAEETFFLGPCPIFDGFAAICQVEAAGEGKALFGKPHMHRQRAAIGRGLCDICGESLKASTKISLSHARPQPHGAQGWAVLQVEPMMHKQCALVSINSCPSLRRDLEQGTLQIRQVFKWRAQCAIMSPEYVETIVGRAAQALGHAKVELQKWQDRDLAWLERSAK